MHQLRRRGRRRRTDRIPGTDRHAGAGTSANTNTNTSANTSANTNTSTSASLGA
jgi:hypothetical protein